MMAEEGCVVPSTSIAGATSFTVSFTSANAGSGEVLFGPSCDGLVLVATSDAGAGTTTHTVSVTGNDLPGVVGNIGITPGTAYYYSTLTSGPNGTETDNNAGKCYSVTTPTS